MSNVNEILETAHISISTATLKVVVDDLSKYKVLFEPRSFLIDDGSEDNEDGLFAGVPVYEEDPKWKEEMKFPPYVLSVSPWYEDNTLSVWVEDQFDLKEISDWLKTFE